MDILLIIPNINATSKLAFFIFLNEKQIYKKIIQCQVLSTICLIMLSVVIVQCQVLIKKRSLKIL